MVKPNSSISWDACFKKGYFVRSSRVKPAASTCKTVNLFSFDSGRQEEGQFSLFGLLEVDFHGHI